MSDFREWLVAQIETYDKAIGVAKDGGAYQLAEYSYYAYREALAEYDKWIEQAPKVYGWHDREGWTFGTDPMPDHDTHSARLVQIEAIKKDDEK